jgi:bacillithiol biosynthesis deacetylase BshB1
MANILIIGPHPDDQELAMGGTIARLADQGHNLLLLDMTDGSPTPHGDRASRLPEAEEAARILSPAPPASPVRRVLLDLPNRTVEHTIDARHRVAGVIRAHQAQILFVPHPEDAHPDHLAVTRIAEDARFDAKLTKVQMPGDEGRAPIYPKWLFYYYATHLRRVADPSFIVDISGYEDRKRRALLAYRSQFVTNPTNAGVPAWVAAADAYFGSRIGAPAGEPFFTKEPMALTSLDSIPL